MLVPLRQPQHFLRFLTHKPSAAAHRSRRRAFFLADCLVLVFRLCCRRLFSSLQPQVQDPPPEARAPFCAPCVMVCDPVIVSAEFPVGGRQLTVQQQRGKRSVSNKTVQNKVAEQLAALAHEQTSALGCLLCRLPYMMCRKLHIMWLPPVDIIMAS